MSHQEKQRIFDEYAKSKGYDNWDSLTIGLIVNQESDELNEHIFEACDLVQAEQQKRIAERFSELVHSTEVGDIFIDDFEKMEKSIANPENKIQ